VFVLATLVVFTSEAVAQFAHHERVKVTPIKEQGKVVGARLKLTLRPTGGEKRVRVGLGPMNYREGGRNDYRALASDPKKGYLVHQFEEITGLSGNKPIEKNFEIRYGEGNKLKGGEKLEVISAWNSTTGNNANSWHLWGMQNVHGINDPGSVVTLPTATK
jgi:hypothetical protein